MSNPNSIYHRLDRLEPNKTMVFPLHDWGEVRASASKLSTRKVMQAKTFSVRRVGNHVVAFRTDILTDENIIRLFKTPPQPRRTREATLRARLHNHSGYADL